MDYRVETTTARVVHARVKSDIYGDQVDVLATENRDTLILATVEGLFTGPHSTTIYLTREQAAELIMALTQAVAILK